MKHMFSCLTLLVAFLVTTTASAQEDKSKRPSPPAKVTQKIASGATISIDYSQLSLRGRVVGESVEPYKDSVWRMGANEATVFETDRDVTIEGKKLPKGKYSMFGVYNDQGFTIMFNSAWNISGTQYNANKATDVISVTVAPYEGDPSIEKLTYTIDPSGKVTLWWGGHAVDFNVK